LVIALETAARAGEWPGVDLFDFVTATGAWAADQPGAEPGAHEPRGEAEPSDGGA